MKAQAIYPDTYLHIEECRSGQTWIVPIAGDELMDLELRVAKWAKQEFGGQLEIDGDFMDSLQGDYYARIMTDGRPPESVVCWAGGGFYLKESGQ